MFDDHTYESPVFPRDRFHPIVKNIFIPAVSVFIVALFKMAFPSIFGETRFLLFYLPILMSAGLGGVMSGIVASLFSSIAIIYFFTFPYGTFAVNSADVIDVAIYFIEGVIISVVIEGLYGARENAQKALHALQSSQERYKLIVENATDFAIFMIDTKGKVLSWNSGAVKLMGYDTDEILGKSFVRFYTKEDKLKKRPKKELEQAARVGRALDDNWTLTKNGDRFWASGLTMPVRSATGQVVGYEKIIRDATESKKQQEKRDDFINIATHELRTPVTSMNVYINVLQRRLLREKNAESLKLFEKVNGQLKRLNILIQDLLDVGRIHNQKLSMNKEYLDIGVIVADTVEELRQAANAHTIQLQGIPHASVYADKSRINQVVTNLLSNAIKYSPDKKKIIVSLNKENKSVVVRIKDFGAGIRKEDQKRIFDRFFRAKSQKSRIVGLGLGLYISREIIRQHRGVIGVESTFGKGSTFFFKLPLSRQEKKRYAKRSTKRR